MPQRGPDPTIVTPEVLRGWQLPEPAGDKNSRGSILVIGGSWEPLGAVRLAAEAAMRAGAGKLQVATVASVASHAAAALPEALVRSLPETDGGAISADAAEAGRELGGAGGARSRGGARCRPRRAGDGGQGRHPGVRRPPAPAPAGPARGRRAGAG